MFCLIDDWLSNLSIRGTITVSATAQKFAFTNLLDGICVFSIRTLSSLGTISQRPKCGQNIALGLEFIDDHHLISGDHRKINLYEVDTLRLVSSFPGKDGNRWVNFLNPLRLR